MKRNINETVVLDREATIFVPPMEPFGARFIAAAFRGEGYPAETLPENDETLALGLRHTGGGECVPCPSTLGSLLWVMRERSLDPARVAFFLPTACGPCRFGQYEKLTRIVLDRLGLGAVRIISPSAENAYAGISGGLRRKIWRGIVLSDVLRKIGMKLRPYEVEPGAIDRALEEGVRGGEREFVAGGADPLDSLKRTVERVRAIPRREERRPKIGIVGEVYVRHDPFANGGLVREIEALGGEALMTTFAEWIFYTTELSRRLLVEESPWRVGKRLELFINRKYYEAVERSYYGATGEILRDRHEPTIEEVMEAGGPYVPWRFEGEAILTIGRALLFIRREGVGAVVNASPVFCMPGTVTSAIFPRIESETGVPVLCLFYDGSGGANRSLGPHLHFLRERLDGSAPAGLTERAPGPPGPPGPVRPS